MRAVERRVVALLRSYKDALEDWDGGSSGDGVKLMPSMWNEGSYVELERALRELRDGTPAQRRLWWHVSARYLWTTTRIGVAHVKRTRLGPVVMDPPQCEVEVVREILGSTAWVRLRTWSDRVDPVLVDEGVAAVANLMYKGDHGRVVVPKTLRNGVESRVASA